MAEHAMQLQQEQPMIPEAANDAVFYMDNVHPDISNQVRKQKVNIGRAFFESLGNTQQFSKLVEDLHFTRDSANDSKNK